MSATICPPEHRHEQRQTCYAQHGCRCQPCKDRRSADAGRWYDEAAKRQPARCGTLAGYSAHRRAGERACDLCRAANTGYQHGVKTGHRAAAAAAARAAGTASAELVTVTLPAYVVRMVATACRQQVARYETAGRIGGVKAPIYREQARLLASAAERLQPTD